MHVTVSYGAASKPAEPIAAHPRILFDRCPLCESRSFSLLRTADCVRHPLYNPVIAPTINWMQCADCDHVFTDGYYSSKTEQVLFQKTHPNQQPGADFENRRFVSSEMVEKVAGFAKGGAWLDVGFGNGSLLFTADEWGYRPVGLDLRPSSVEAMSRLGVEAHCVDIAQFDASDSFSVVSMADVLEHMPFPKKGLAAARRMLRSDGVLFCSLPNYNCMAWKLLDGQNANPFWGEIEHFHNFSRVRLTALLDEMGFEVVHYGISMRYRICMELIARCGSR